MTGARPLLLDTYCCGGGASAGYAAAGFDVLGIDRQPQPRYPYPILVADAVTALDDLLAGRTLTFTGRAGVLRRAALRDLSAVVGSPPCQRHTPLVHRTGLRYDDFIPHTRDRFAATGLPWVIENVEGAPLRDPLLLCGTMFGLGASCRDGRWRQLRRHRLFEAPVPLSAPGRCAHRGQPMGVYGGLGGTSRRGFKGTTEESGRAMGIGWLPSAALVQAIPPVYAYWVGLQLLAMVPSAPAGAASLTGAHCPP